MRRGFQRKCFAKKVYTGGVSSYLEKEKKTALSAGKKVSRIVTRDLARAAYHWLKVQ